MGTAVAVIAGLAAACAVIAICAWFLYTLFKTLISLPLQGLASLRGPAVLTIDPRLKSNNDVARLKQLTRTVAAHDLRPVQISAPPKVPYRSILGIIPYAKIPNFRLDDEMSFFETERSQQGFMTYERLVPAQQVSEEPFLADLDTLQRPFEKTVEGRIVDVLALKQSYPKADLAPIADDELPDLGSIPGKFDVMAPSLRLPKWPGPLRILNGFIAMANQEKIAAHEKAMKQWKELQYDYDEARGHLREALIKLQGKLAASNEGKQTQWRNAQVLVATNHAAWETRRREEVALLQSVLDSWQSGYLDNPAAQAKLVLEYTLLPRWLPIDVASAFDHDSGVMIVDAQFPDVGQMVWSKRLADKVKPATKVETKQANERLYPALALRYAVEIARAVNDNLVKTIVLNGWADYIDRTTGETKRAYVSSLLADTGRLRALNLPAVDVVQAFTALKGVTARAQTVVPVAPIVPMNTNDRRFVDARDVLDGMPSEQNLATMPWEDFEHLCRELFEKEFASDGAEVKITQASRDAGVDAIIFNPDLIKGGKIVIQAKRYAATVDVSAVRDLFGTVHNEGAMKGILVATSTFGSDSYNFIANKPLTLINGTQLLRLLGKHGYAFRIDLAEAKKAARERYAPASET